MRPSYNLFVSLLSTVAVLGITAALYRPLLSLGWIKPFTSSTQVIYIAVITFVVAWCAPFNRHRQ